MEGPLPEASPTSSRHPPTRWDNLGNVGTGKVSGKVGKFGKCREMLVNVGKFREIRIMTIIYFSIIVNFAILRPFSEGSPVRKCR